MVIKVQTLMRQWIGRICDVDETAEIKPVKGLGMLSHWPEDLISCVGEQLTLALTELKPSACELVCVLVLEALPGFAQRQRSWIESKAKTLAPERICAYVNNFDRFCRLLEDRRVQVYNATGTNNAKLAVKSVVGSVPNSGSKLDGIFRQLIDSYRAEGRIGLRELIHLVCNDFKEGLSQGLFQDDWVESSSVLETLRSTLDDYVNDLASWLASREDCANVVLG